MSLAPKLKSPCLDTEKEQIIETLLYFKIFSYPLKGEEVCHFTKTKDLSKVALKTLVERNLVNEKNGYYGINLKDDWINEREAAEQRFHAITKKIRRSAKIISRFPYVEGVALSGASSKGLMKEDGDVDFFIITTPNRLWVCRTLLVLYKKIFRLNSKKYFCVNYFVSTDNLKIPDENRFTATEIVYLTPVYNRQLFNKFLDWNDWVSAYYPNCDVRLDLEVNEKKSRIRKISERILNGKLGERLDNWTMKRTVKRWKKKFGHMKDHDFELTMRSRNDVSKHHPSNFQKIVLSRYEKNLQEFKAQHGIELGK